MISGQSLKAQILFLCMGLSFITLLVGGIGTFGIAKVATTYSEVSTVVLPKTKLIGEFMNSFLRVRIRLRTLGLPGLSKAAADTAVAEAKKFIEAGDSADREFAAMNFADGERPVYERFHQQWQAFKTIGERVLAAHAKGTPESAKEMMQLFLVDCPEAATTMNSAVDAAIKFEAERERSYIAAADEATSFANLLSQLVSLVAFLAAMTVGYFFASSLARRISAVTEELTRNAESLGAASQKIATASEALSKSAAIQSSNLQQSVSAVEEVSAMVSKNADNARQSQTVSNISHEAAGRGKQAVDGMIQSIEDINQSNSNIMKQIEVSNREISDIVKVIADIGNKTKVINDIVFQTKLLSFNASVEAARAGEHGKGFAVVAEEVGNLAQMSGNAAKEISTMLVSSIHKVESIVNDTKSKVEALVIAGRQRVEAGTLTAKRCGEILDEVVTNVHEVNQRVGEIATASQEQAQGITEITKTMDNLDKVTQQNAEASEDSAAYAQQLRSQAENLHSVVRELVATVYGRNQLPEQALSVSQMPPNTGSAGRIASLTKHREQKLDPRQNRKPREGTKYGRG